MSCSHSAHSLLVPVDTRSSSACSTFSRARKRRQGDRLLNMQVRAGLNARHTCSGMTWAVSYATGPNRRRARRNLPGVRRNLSQNQRRNHRTTEAQPRQNN